MLPGWVLSHFAGAFPGRHRPAPLPSRAQFRMPWEYQESAGQSPSNSPAFRHLVYEPGNVTHQVQQLVVGGCQGLDR
jgi:hypothetical protein